MTISSTMHRIQPHLNLHLNDNENIPIEQDMNKQQIPILSNLFGCSIHNCLCKTSKTGLVLYPKDIQNKNVILLVCEQCYNYKLENNTQHIQLEKWYFNIYKDSNSFYFKSKFLQNEDGTFHFYSPILNTDDSFNIIEREMENWEKEAIQLIIQKKLDNVRV